MVNKFSDVENLFETKSAAMAMMASRCTSRRRVTSGAWRGGASNSFTDWLLSRLERRAYNAEVMGSILLWATHSL